MANVYRRRIDAADGDYIIDDLSNEYSIGQVFVAFLSGGSYVTPTAGTLTVRAGMFDGQYLDASAGGIIDAPNAGVGDVSYVPVVFNGPVTNIKITSAGVVGADQVDIAIWRDE